MEINVLKSERIAKIWLTNSEKHNPLIQNALKPLFEEYKAKKYTVAVFCSGNDDLKANTSYLLRNNRSN
ncbi:MAG: hypothetical protein FWF94_04765 [Oscillospiraceae bacterium]|nr:hypothetical protein [Oscillospiraceae bacterium]